MFRPLPKSPSRLLLSALLLLQTCLLAMACADGDRSEIRIAGTFQQEACDVEALVWEPAFASFRPGGDDTSGVIHFLSRTTRVEIQDHFALQIRDIDRIRARLGEWIDFEERGRDALITATLNLHERCPDTRTFSTLAVGQVRFTEFTGQPGSMVRFEAEFDLVDSRFPDVIMGEGFRVDASFRIRNFPPYQSFNAAF